MVVHKLLVFIYRERSHLLSRAKLHTQTMSWITTVYENCSCTAFISDATSNTMLLLNLTVWLIIIVYCHHAVVQK